MILSTDGQMDKVKPIYHPFQFHWSGGIMKLSWLSMSFIQFQQHFIEKNPNVFADDPLSGNLGLVGENQWDDSTIWWELMAIIDS